MKSSARASQRGISLLGLLFVGGILAVLGLVGAQVLPTALEFMSIQKAAKKAAAEGGTVQQVKAAFDRAGAIDNITSISGKDLEVTKAGDNVVVNFAYDREIHLAGPAYLLLKYKGSSSAGYK